MYVRMFNHTSVAYGSDWNNYFWVVICIKFDKLLILQMQNGSMKQTEHLKLIYSGHSVLWRSG